MISSDVTLDAELQKGVFAPLDTEIEGVDEPDFPDCDLMSVVELLDELAEAVVGCDEVNGPTEVVQVVSDEDEWRAGRRVLTRRQR